jgi:hypothetical protein
VLVDSAARVIIGGISLLAADVRKALHSFSAPPGTPSSNINVSLSEDDSLSVFAYI